MTRLIVAEFRKLFTTRLWLWLLLASAGITALYVSLSIAFADNPSNPTPPLTTAPGQNTLFSLGSAAGALVAVLGAIGMTGEYRHRTATATFLAKPQRGRVVFAKLVTYASIGVGYALVCVAVTAAIALPWLAAEGIEVVANGQAGTIGGVIAAVAIYALVGVGLGALVRDQVATVVGLLIYLFVVEPIVTRIPALADWTRYLPDAAANALTHLSQTDQEFLEPWLGGVVLAGYGIAFAVAGSYFAVRRDVT
jgi:ABC-2 type transport system permease protein